MISHYNLDSSYVFKHGGYKPHLVFFMSFKFMFDCFMQGNSLLFTAAVTADSQDVKCDR